MKTPMCKQQTITLRIACIATSYCINSHEGATLKTKILFVSAVIRIIGQKLLNCRARQRKIFHIDKCKKKPLIVIGYRHLDRRWLISTPPNNNDILDKLCHCQNLATELSHIEVNNSDIAKTALSIAFGHYDYEFLRMPFGFIRTHATTF